MDSDRLAELFDRYLDQELTSAEEAELIGLLARPECQEHWRRLASLEGRIQEEFLAPASEGAQPKTSRKLSTTSFRRSKDRPDRKHWWTGFAAAAAVFSVILFLVLDPNPDLASVEQARASRASREAARQREARRREAEARLQEIERKRETLAQPSIGPAQDPAAEEKRKQALEALKGDKEKIERELREAIQRAKKPEPPPAPTEQTRGEKPVPPQEPPQEQKPPSTTEAAIATVERVEGPASIVAADGKFRVQAGQGVLSGQGLETGSKGYLVVKYPDGTTLEIGEDSDVRGLKSAGGKRLHLDKGVVRARVARQPKNEPMIFATPHAEEKVVGTTLRILVDPDPKRGTKLEVEEGKVELKNLAGKTVLVEGGHYAVAAAGVELVARPVLDDPEILVGHWTFDEAGGTTVADAGGSGPAGLLKNGAARVPGRIGRALFFDGVDDFVEIADHPSLEGMGTITVAAWVLLSKLPGKSLYSVPMAKDLSYRLVVDPGGGVSFAVQTENNLWYSAGTEAGSRALPLNTWCHVAGTYDGTRVRIYSNGVLGETGSRALSGAIFKSGSPLTLGKSVPNSVIPFNGAVDDLRIYKRALTQAEIQTLAAQRNKSGTK